MSASGYVHLEVEQILKETDAAFYVLLEDGSRHWIPKSQIADPETYTEGDTSCTVSITEWIADQKGLA